MMSMFNPSQFQTLEQIETFVHATDVFTLEYPLPRLEKARWVRDRLLHFRYTRLPRTRQGMLRQFFRAITGYSDAQLSRHIRAYRSGERIRCTWQRRQFPPTYTEQDRELLALIDNATGRLSGTLAAQFCADQFRAGDTRFVRLKDISSATVYRLRKTKRYTLRAITIEKTKPTQVSIGERRKPQPNGLPGFIRVDTVHQGDFGKQKGVYHINLVDEVTQWEVVIAVEQIAESLLKDVLKVAILLFPFRIRNFHSDNGSEYINYTLAGLLEKLRIRQTKGRPRHSNDNGLAETKNGAIIRKEMGHFYIPGVFAPRINVFYKDHFIPYLNFHRPCHFPETITLNNGKVIVKYPRKNCMTPFQKLQSLPDWEKYLRRGITAADLRTQATLKTPLQAAHEKNEARQKLFSVIIPKLSATVPPSLTQ